MPYRDATAVIGAILGAITLSAAAVFAVRSLYRLLRPIRIQPSVIVVFDGSAPDQICAKITTEAPKCSTSCSASRGARTHWRRSPCATSDTQPFPRSYTARCASRFRVLRCSRENESVKLEPHERVKLHHRRMSNHPLSFFLSPMFLVEVELSTGRVFRSRRLSVPGHWRFRPTNPSTREEAGRQNAESAKADT